MDVINVKRAYRACWDIKNLSNKKKSTVYVNFYAAVYTHEKRNTAIQKLLIVVFYGTRIWLKKMWLYMMSHDDAIMMAYCNITMKSFIICWEFCSHSVMNVKN